MGANARESPAPKENDMSIKALLCGYIGSMVFGILLAVAGIDVIRAPTVSGWLLIFIGSVCVSFTIATMVNRP